MTFEEEGYYVRFRGRVSGPHDWDRLVSLARRGRVSRFHDLSTDGRSWFRASEMPALFDPAAASGPGSGHRGSQPGGSRWAGSAGGAELAEVERSAPWPVAAEVASPAADASGGEAAAPPELVLTPEDMAAKEEWYYVADGAQRGPVDGITIASMLQEGRLTAADYVWRPGMDRWVHAEQTELAAVTPEPPREVGSRDAGGRRPGGQRGKAMTGMILSLVGIIVLGPILGLLGGILSGVALAGMRRSGHHQGRGMAITGLAVGVLDVVGWMIVLSLVFGSG